jgi:serine/threonine protein kinase
MRRGTTKAADYWALGVLIFEMLVGDPPFKSLTGDPWDTFRRTLSGRFYVSAACGRGLVQGGMRLGLQPAPLKQVLRCGSLRCATKLNHTRIRPMVALLSSLPEVVELQRSLRMQLFCCRLQVPNFISNTAADLIFKLLQVGVLHRAVCSTHVGNARSKLTRTCASPLLCPSS